MFITAKVNKYAITYNYPGINCTVIMYFIILMIILAYYFIY